MATYYKGLHHQDRAWEYLESLLTPDQIEQALNLFTPSKTPKKIYKLGDRLPDTINLVVPYYSQRDNQRDPEKTCNVTCVAMCLSFFGVKAKQTACQLEDELDQWLAANNLDRYWHQHLAKLFRAYGVSDRFTTSASWQEIKVHLANGNPAIVSARFTRAGHLVVIRGYSERERCWYANDPWGRYQRGSGYESVSGENLVYPYQLLESISYGGAHHTWAHFPSQSPRLGNW